MTIRRGEPDAHGFTLAELARKNWFNGAIFWAGDMRVLGAGLGLVRVPPEISAETMIPAR